MGKQWALQVPTASAEEGIVAYIEERRYGWLVVWREHGKKLSRSFRWGYQVTNSQLLTGPAQEGAIVVLGSLLIGIPIGLGLALLAVRILGLFFSLPPPLLTVPAHSLVWFVSFMVITSAIALSAALAVVTRVRPAWVLRDP